MSFSYDTKNELCRLPVQKLCCARAEAYGILLYCNTFSATEVRIITENPNFAARLPKLFRRAFNLSFDRQPEKEQEEGKRIFRIERSWIISSTCWASTPDRIWCFTSTSGWWRSHATGRLSCGGRFSQGGVSPTPRSATIWN